MVGGNGSNHYRMQYRGGHNGGKILSVIVGVLGLLIIPMFTVYVNNIVSVFHTVTTAAAEAAEEIPEKTGENGKKNLSEAKAMKKQ